MNVDLLARSIALRVHPAMGPKPISYETTVELIVRVILEMKKEGGPT